MKIKLFKNKDANLTKKSSGMNKLLSYQLLYWIVLVLVLSGFGYLGYFVYINYYETITQAKQIEVLRSEVAPDFIDTKKVEKVISGIEKKLNTQYTESENQRNPFYSSQAPAPTATSTQTPAETPAAN